MDSKNINYLGREYSELKNSLQQFIKSYYPNDYQDFTESSPGSLLIDLASYVGDVLGFHMDKNLQELYSNDPKQRRTAIQLAQRLGYKPKASVSSIVDLDIFIEVPATGSAASREPDSDYFPIIKKDSQFKSTDNILFELIEDVNFKLNTKSNKREQVVSQVDSSDIPQNYLLKKTVKAISGETKSFQQTISTPQKYLSIEMPSDIVSEIIKVEDSNSNIWYEVDSLAQDTIFVEEKNNIENNPTSTDYANVPNLLKLKRVPKRFTVSINEDNLTYLNFGSGITDYNDEQLIPNPQNVGSPLLNASNKFDYAIDPENFLKTKTYGEAPGNTTLTISYREGGGVNTNVGANTINKPLAINFEFANESSLNSNTIESVRNSITCNNEIPATGGKNSEANDEIVQNAFSELKSQKRCITKEDYIVRTYALPSRFGNIAKSYVEKDQFGNLGLNLHILAYNNNNQLTTASDSLKNNLRNYLKQYRMLTDTINILDGKIINIKVNFEIVVENSKNKNEVLIQCIEKLKTYFNINNWNFNQPIIYSDILKTLMDVPGVQSIPFHFDKLNNKQRGIWIECKTDNGYSNFSVDIDALTSNGIVYSPQEIAIFEVKNPNVDIEGNVL